MLGAVSWVETYRGTVYRWEVDNVDHFTVAYYFARFEDATLNALDALGVRPDERGARPWTVMESRVRYVRELRVNDIMHVRSGVVAVDDAKVALGHELYDSGSATLCTTVLQHVRLGDPAHGRAVAPTEAAARLRVDWPHEIAPKESIAEPEGDAGFADTQRDTIKAWEVDPSGHAAPPAYIHRFSAANGQLLAAFGMSPAYMREQRRGFSTFEFHLRTPGGLRAGDPVATRSALIHLGNSSMRILHRMANTRTGEVVAVLAQSGVHLDLDARRPTPLPDPLRERAKTLLVAA
jgi:acyl-CoA thioesterase FadM